MSWSINIIGHPSNIDAKLAEQSNIFEGLSKEEFDAAQPHISALVRQNWNPTETVQPLINLIASGHGYSVNGEHKQRYLSVEIKPMYTTIV